MTHQLSVQSPTYNVNFMDYQYLVADHDVDYTLNDVWIQSAGFSPEPGWVIIVSLVTQETLACLGLLLPIIRKFNIPFRMISNQLHQFKQNAGGFGQAEAGRTIMLFVGQDETLRRLWVDLEPISTKFHGQKISDAVPLGSCLFVQSLTRDLNNGSPIFRFRLPITKIPIGTDILGDGKVRKRRIVGRYYIPLIPICNTLKGSIYKAINLKWLSFSYCAIKEAKAYAWDDPAGRTLKDRLLWQFQVLTHLKGKEIAPKPIGMFEHDENLYIVMDFIEGPLLGKKCDAVLQGKPFHQTSIEERAVVLRLFLSLLRSVKRLHQSGYIHRDLHVGNAIVGKDNNVILLDFELAYRLNDDTPNPPFLYGTRGYVAPEQAKYEKPIVANDLYSLGAILIRILIGEANEKFVVDVDEYKQTIADQIGEKRLLEVAYRALSFDPVCRPGIAEFEKVIISILSLYEPKKVSK